MCLTLNSAAEWAGSIFHVMREAGEERVAIGGSFHPSHPSTIPTGGSSLFLDFLADFKISSGCV
jgi:hypothetical protein